MRLIEQIDDLWYTLAAVTHNNVELIALLMEYGADIHATTGYETPIHRAAEFGGPPRGPVPDRARRGPADRTPSGRSVLAAARAARRSRDVVPMLVELLPTKSRARTSSSWPGATGRTAVHSVRIGATCQTRTVCAGSAGWSPASYARWSMRSRISSASVMGTRIRRTTGAVCADTARSAT